MTIPSSLRKRAKRIALYLLIAASGTSLTSPLNASEPHIELASHDSVHWCGWTVEEQLNAASNTPPPQITSTDEKPNALTAKQSDANNKTAPSVMVVKQAELFGTVSMPLVSITKNDELRITTCNYDNWLKNVLASVPGVNTTTEATDQDKTAGVLQADDAELGSAVADESTAVAAVEDSAMDTEVADAEAAEEFAPNEAVASTDQAERVDDLAIDAVDDQYYRDAYDDDEYYDNQYYDEDRYYQEDLVAEPWNPESPIAEPEITVANAPTVCTPVDDVQLSVNGELAVNGQTNNSPMISDTPSVDMATQRAAEASLDAETNVTEVALDEAPIDAVAVETETVETEVADVEIAQAETTEAEIDVVFEEPTLSDADLDADPAMANLDEAGHSVLAESADATEAAPSITAEDVTAEQEITATDDDSFDQVDDVVITPPAMQASDAEQAELADNSDLIQQVVQGPVTAEGTLPILLDEVVVSDERADSETATDHSVIDETPAVVSRTSDEFNEWLASLAVASTPGTMSWIELSEPLAAIYQDAVAEADPVSPAESSDALATVEQPAKSQPEQDAPTAADLVGSSAVIATIEEEYQPYDVASASEPEATIAQLDTTQPADSDVQAMPEQTSTPADTEPEATEPEATEPEAIEPEAIEPEAIEPEAIEPEAIEPEAIEPEAIEPEAIEPEAIEPEAIEPESTETAAPITAIDRLINPDRPWTIDSCWVIRQPGWSVFHQEPQPRALTVLKAEHNDAIAATESGATEEQPVTAEPAAVLQIADAADTPPLPQSLVGSADCLLDHWLWQADLLAQDNPWVQELSDAENLGAAIVQLSDRYTTVTQDVLTEIATKLPAPAAKPAPQPVMVQELADDEQRIATADVEPATEVTSTAPAADAIVTAQEPVVSTENQLQPYQELLDNVIDASKFLVDDIQRQAQAAAKVADSSENSDSQTLR
ncbi:hypothetical protein SV7mr_34910 [Stieleria bergensis]|uniref:Uncharacterized protein n=1 Tax=Stieleria bergensis TaxID=2528025 RepID=A0A517SXZ8_9BACT|nr:hypothetical protein SV7mr_34910 [Planctomycetes bacterium SV_7m_r]